MANPFVGTWDTKFDSIDGGTGTSNSATVTVTESIRFEGPGTNVLDGMYEGLQGAQPSTLHGTFNPNTSQWTGKWMNYPTGPEQGNFTFTLRKDTFTGKWGQGDGAETLNWNGRLRRDHVDRKGKLSEIPDLQHTG